MTDLSKTIFDIEISGGEPREGSLLVAEPFLKDAPFKHAVIILVDYDKNEHSLGVVVNKSTQYTLKDLIPEIECDAPIFSGGPVGTDRLIYLHTLGSLFNGSTQVAPGLWIGGDFEDLKKYIRAGYPTDGLIRFFIGYSGWQAGQLDEELADKVWAVTDKFDPANLLIDSDDAAWHRVVKEMGETFRGWRFHPMDPSSN